MDFQVRFRISGQDWSFRFRVKGVYKDVWGLGRGIRGLGLGLRFRDLGSGLEFSIQGLVAHSLGFGALRINETRPVLEYSVVGRRTL